MRETTDAQEGTQTGRTPPPEALLAALSAEGDPTAPARLHARLVDSARHAGLLDVAYRTMATPVGTLLLAATEEGLLRVAYVDRTAGRQDAVLTDLADRVSPRVLEAPGRLDPAAEQLEEYFGGRRTRFDIPLDLRLSKGFRREVISRLPGISYGRTSSYAEVAAVAGSPRAVRAVGTACATNPLPVVLPCHRVVRSDGSAGGYVGGAAAKETLLTLESAG